MQRETDVEHGVIVETGTARLEGSLVIPAHASGVVIFVHGSGSSRHSPRNQYVASKLQERPLGTLLFDLLTAEEEQTDLLTRRLRFDIDLLAKRAVGAIDWLSNLRRDLNIGLFGASTGAAAALTAAAERMQVRAVVSRGGRPDLAMDVLPSVRSPTLLIVGELDTPVIEMNRQAMAQMDETLETDLRIVPGATHLFGEPGALERVADMAGQWFGHFLASGPA